MFKRQSFSSKYICVPTNNISSWSVSSRRTMFTRRADTEHRKISDIAGRKSKTNRVQNRGTKFGATKFE
jgi:hypothetical protein